MCLPSETVTLLTYCFVFWFRLVVDLSGELYWLGQGVREGQGRGNISKGNSLMRCSIDIRAREQQALVGQAELLFPLETESQRRESCLFHILPACVVRCNTELSDLLYPMPERLYFTGRVAREAGLEGLQSLHSRRSLCSALWCVRVWATCTDLHRVSKFYCRFLFQPLFS